MISSMTRTHFWAIVWHRLIVGPSSALSANSHQRSFSRVQKANGIAATGMLSMHRTAWESRRIIIFRYYTSEHIGCCLIDDLTEGLLVTDNVGAAESRCSRQDFDAVEDGVSLCRYRICCWQLNPILNHGDPNAPRGSATTQKIS